MEHIELNTFLKIKGIASSGGEAKQFIRSNLVKVNGQLETRNRLKLVKNDKVEFENETFVVTKEILRE